MQLNSGTLTEPSATERFERLWGDAQRERVSRRGAPTGMAACVVKELEQAIADGRRLMEARRYEEALRLSNELLASHPDSIEPYFRRALVLWALKQPNAAMDDLTSAISKSDDEPALFFFRGMWRIEMGFVEAGIEDMDKTIALEAQTESAYYSGSARLCRAVGYRNQGDTELALRELDSLNDSTTTYLVGRVWNLAALRQELSGA